MTSGKVRAIAAASVIAYGLLNTAQAFAHPLEDEPGWSCVDDGNRVCGPENDEGKPAGCYDDGGVLVAVWPCEAWKPSDGYRHPDGTVTWPKGCQINLYTAEIVCSDKNLGPDWDSNPEAYFV